MQTDLEKALDGLTSELKALNERAASGEDVAAEREKKEAELKAAEEKAAADKKAAEDKKDDTPLTESERAELVALRENQAEAEDHALVEKAIKQAEQEETHREARMVEIARKMVASGTKTEDAKAALLAEIKATRTGSRYVGPGAELSLVQHVAAGGEIKTAEGGTKEVETKVAGHRGVKALWETKDNKFGTFIGAIYRHRKGMASEAETMWLQEIQSKALAEGTASSGGYLVPQEWMPDILGFLRNAGVVRRAGPRIVPFNKQMNQTSVSSGASAYYVDENAKIPLSEPTFAETTLLTPKNLTGMVAVSNYLLHDAPQAEAFVRADLVDAIANREDAAFLRGTGTGGEPTGIRNFGGITLDPLSTASTPDGFQMSLGQLRRIRARYRTMNTGPLRLAWFFHPSLITHLETLTDTTGRFLTDANILQVGDDGLTGTIEGIPFYSTTTMPDNLTFGNSTNASEVILANLNELIIGDAQSLELDVSSEAAYTVGANVYSAFQQNQTLFRAIIRHDIAHRRPAEILVQRGVLV